MGSEPETRPKEARQVNGEPIAFLLEVRFGRIRRTRVRDVGAVAKLAEICTGLPAQFLHSQKLPYYLQLKQSDMQVLSPAQDDRTDERL